MLCFADSFCYQLNRVILLQVFKQFCNFLERRLPCNWDASRQMGAKHFVGSEKEFRAIAEEFSISAFQRTFPKMDFRSAAQDLHFQSIWRQERLLRIPPRSDRTGFNFRLELRRTDDILERRFVDRAKRTRFLRSRIERNRLSNHRSNSTPHYRSSKGKNFLN